MIGSPYRDLFPARGQDGLLHARLHRRQAPRWGRPGRQSTTPAAGSVSGPRAGSGRIGGLLVCPCPLSSSAIASPLRMSAVRCRDREAGGAAGPGAASRAWMPVANHFSGSGLACGRCGPPRPLGASLGLSALSLAHPRPPPFCKPLLGLLRLLTLDDQELHARIETVAESYRGFFPDLCMMVGIVILGRYFGWRLIRLACSPRIWRLTVKWFGDPKDLFPERGRLAHKSVGLAIVDKIGDFWGIVRGSVARDTLSNDDRKRIL